MGGAGLSIPPAVWGTSMVCLTRFRGAGLSALLLLVAFGPGTVVHSDEGMWLLNNPPRKLLREKYQFDLTDAWLEHAQKASLRFNNGGSGGFVSSDGLIVTNHHIASDA